MCREISKLTIGKFKLIYDFNYLPKIKFKNLRELYFYDIVGILIIS